MPDHDQLLKAFLQRFLGEFFAAFLPEWSRRFDFRRVEWLENEVFSDPPEGQRQVLDLVAKLPLLDASGIDVGAVADAFLALIHIEVESGTSVRLFRRRFFRYYASLRHRHELPVLPVAVLLRVGLNGLGFDVYREVYGTLEVVRFSYFYVGFPRLQAIEYLESGNPAALGLMGLMKVPDEDSARLRAETLRRIAELVRDEFGRFLLTQSIETYWSLSDEQQAEFDQLTVEPQYDEVRAMATTTFEKGIEKGIEKGFQTGIEKGIERGRNIGVRQTMRDLLQDRFGPLPADVLARVESLPDDQFPVFRRAFADNKPLAELLSFLGIESLPSNTQTTPDSPSETVRF